MSPRKAPPAAADLIASTLQGHRAQAESGRLREQNKALLAKLAIAEDRASIAEALKASAKLPKPIKAKKQELLHKRVATPVFMASDWHVEETINPRTVNGLNHYDLTEADARIERLGNAMMWMIDHNRKSFEIRECVLWLGGDLLTGYIHQELLEGNSLSPIQTVLWLQTRIERLIGKLLSVEGMELVTIVTNHGNHGRTTQKTQISTGAANSYEWLLYNQIRRTFEANPRISFNIADGEFIYLDINGVIVRFTHGDAVSYGSGVGGITIPLNKAIARWQTHKVAAITCLGHFHAYYDLPSFVVNSSLIGVSPYGMRVGGFEVPSQASFLIDAVRKSKCMSTPLWVVSSDHHKKAR